MITEELLTLITAPAALLAFLIGLHTLIGRERRSPYVINAIFSTFLICLMGSALAVAAVLFISWQCYLVKASKAFLLLGFGSALYRVYKIHVRFTYFVDAISLKNFGWVRWIKDTWRNYKSKPPYEHNPEPLSPILEEEVYGILKDIRATTMRKNGTDLQSIAVAVQHQGQANQLVAKLAGAFLAKSYPVQYLVASRHPIEFVKNLKDQIEKGGLEWTRSAERIVVIDAYSRHFGFVDSIYRSKNRELEKMGVSCIGSRMSYAGMHTALQKAFNKVKSWKRDGNVRKPALVVYEDTYAISDLESPNLYRVFVRHVLASERLWGGMLTVFIETVQSETDWTLLRSYASVEVDLRKAQVDLTDGESRDTP